MILCECGEVIGNCKFRDYIKTSANPSSPTIGHQKCGLVFNFIDDTFPRRYSSRKELKSLAMRFAEKNNMDTKIIGKFMLEVDRLKTNGNLSDNDILVSAFKML
ncbi:MAG: hypothetical protein SCH70_00980 [Candidatus Methanoperedens sp.]|nr:hypothetical protein [Candidatus Methanoperedens sp.]